MIRVAVRDKNGTALLFRVLPADAKTHEQAIELARHDFPEARCVLSSVPALEKVPDDGAEVAA